MPPQNCPDYAVKNTAYQIGKESYLVRALLDRQQFSDPQKLAEKMGISSAQWPLFGTVWPSAVALANKMNVYPIKGKSILEVGCGIGLPSLVLKKRGADITACDYHPLVEEFLRFNTDQNQLEPINFFTAPWAKTNKYLGRFDIIIGSDLLYERGHPQLLSDFLYCHAKPDCQVFLVDPGRSHGGRFTTEMSLRGYSHESSSIDVSDEGAGDQFGKLLSYTRTGNHP